MPTYEDIRYGIDYWITKDPMLEFKKMYLDMVNDMAPKETVIPGILKEYRTYGDMKVVTHRNVNVVVEDEPTRNMFKEFAKRILILTPGELKEAREELKHRLDIVDKMLEIVEQFAPEEDPNATYSFGPVFEEYNYISPWQNWGNLWGWQL